MAMNRNSVCIQMHVLANVPWPGSESGHHEEMLQIQYSLYVFRSTGSDVWTKASSIRYRDICKIIFKSK